MNNRTLSILAFVVLAHAGTVEAAMAEDGFYFFSEADRARIKQSAGTEWGARIVDGMRKEVAERLTHSLVVPATESGHFHFYFCPEHKRMLTFDWDKPHQHYCPECEAHLEGERYDYAWIRFIHGQNQLFLRNCTLLSIVTGEREYLEHIRSMLLDYAAKYPAYHYHGHDMKPGAPYGGRMFSQTLDEANWIVDIAPAYFEAKAVMSSTEASLVENQLLRLVAGTILRHQTGGNWQVWHNGGTASVAIAVGDEELLKIALDDPAHGYHYMMKTGVTEEGWWDERSPGYHFYPLHAMIRTAEAVRCREIDLYDDNLRRMFTAPLDGVYGDLTFPAHNDGWHGLSLMGQASLYEIAALRFGDARFRELLARCYGRSERKHWTALLNGETITPDKSPMPLESCVHRDTGVAFLRNAGRTVVLKYGPHGGGHGHPDKLSVNIHDGKEEILPDLGTPGYGVPDYTGWYRKTIAHNTVTVDGTDQLEASGTLIQFAARQDGGIVEASCDAASPGVRMRRRLELTGVTVADSFICESTAAHIYDYVLLLMEPIKVPDSSRGADLPAGMGYDRIKDPREWDCRDSATFELEGARLTLKSEGAFKLITGEAPGKPGSIDAKSTMAMCYPLIVRVSGEGMEVQAEWLFK